MVANSTRQDRGAEPAAPEQVAPPTRAGQQRFGRTTMLLVVLIGTLVAVAFYAFVLGVTYSNGQLAAAVLATCAALWLATQLVRYRFRISLRTFLIAMAVLAAGLAYVGKDFVDARRETAAVKSLNELGVVVSYGDLIPSNAESFQTTGGIRLPIWIRDAVGESYFRRIRNVRFRDSSLEDANLGLLEDLRGAQSLDVRNSKITARGLAFLPIVPEMNTIHLQWEQLSPESVSRLNQQPDLHTVQVTYPVKFPTQTVNGIATPKLDPPPVQTLSGFTTIERLILELDNVNPQCMEVVASLPELRTLNIGTMDYYGHQVQINGLSELAKSSSLENLNITARQFGDRHLLELIEVRTLKHLYLARTGVTQEGIEEFRAARPDVQVIAN